MGVPYERHIEGKKMVLFFSQSKKGPVFEHFTKYGSVTKFAITTLICHSETDLL